MKSTEVISKYVEALKLGHTSDEAEFLATNWAECMELHPEAVTKSDIKHLEMSTKADMQKIRDDFSNVIEKLMVRIDSSFRMVYIGMGSIFTIVCLPYLTKLFGHQ
jgi:hypothetical protein